MPYALLARWLERIKGTMGTSKGKQEKPKRKPGRPRVEVKIYKAPPDADYYRADDIAEIMGLSRSRSYKLIQDMRADLMSEGKLPKYFPLGRVPKAEFRKRMMLDD